jgi:IclR family KDG regulon transcriptional repressor
VINIQEEEEATAAAAIEVFLDETGRGADKSSSTVQTVHRAMSLLLCFDSAHREWTTSDLTAKTGLSRKTVSRLLKTLVEDGFLVLDKLTRRYSIGHSVFRFAYVWVSQASLARIAEAHLKRLTEATGETASLCVWNVNGPLCVAHADAPRPFRFLMAIGQLFTDAANAHSKILLAYGPEQRRHHMVARGLQAHTPFTVTDTGRFDAELGRVLDEGAAYDVQEQQLGVCGVAVPVWDFSGEVRASLSLVMPEVRYSPAEAKRYAQALKQVASALSFELGYQPREKVRRETEDPVSTVRGGSEQAPARE